MFCTLKNITLHGIFPSHDYQRVSVQPVRGKYSWQRLERVTSLDTGLILLLNPPQKNDKSNPKKKTLFHIYTYNLSLSCQEFTLLSFLVLLHDIPHPTSQIPKLCSAKKTPNPATGPPLAQCSAQHPVANANFLQRHIIPFRWLKIGRNNKKPQNRNQFKFHPLLLKLN